MHTKTELKRISKDRLIEMYLDQQRQLERMSDIAGAMAGDGGIAERYQRERDELRDWQRGAYAFFGLVRDAIRKNAADAEAYHKQTARMVGLEDAHRAYLPALVEIAENAGERALKANEVFMGALIRPADPLRQIVQDILVYAKLDALYSTINAQRWEAWTLSDADPSALALDVITQWETTDTITEPLVMRLCEVWKDAPSPRMLIDALRLVGDYNRRPDGQAQQVFCDLRAISLRTLQKYLRAVEDLRALSRTAADLLASADVDLE